MDWFALAVRSQHEKAVQEQLLAKSLEAYVPLYRARRRWSDRTKTLELPLFSRYAFCRFSYEDRLMVLSTPGVLKVVGFGGKPTPVPENEIEAIRAMIASGRGVMPWPVLRLGQRVRIEAGPLHGVEGILVREKSIYRVVVSVELLNRGVAVEIDREEIRPIPVALPGTAALRRERVA